MTSKTTKSFENVGLTHIEESSETRKEMKEIFEKYSQKYFTQKMFVSGLQKSNPYINKILRSLVEEKFITFKTVGRTKFYIRA
tara:strand:+ start:291 stop:539 length:249 start_codon:yes stop_codon:yes gene_type:complete